MGTVRTFMVGTCGGELGPGLAPGPRPVRGRLDGGPAGMVRRQVTERFAGHAAVGGWLISNEMPIYGGEARERGHGLGGADGAGRPGRGRDQPVSLGDGAWGIEVSGVDNGFSVRATAPLSDFVGPHVYRMENDRVRQHYGAAFACELAGNTASRWCWRSSASARLRQRRQRRALLPAGAPQQPAGRGHRLAGLEQHRLRQPGRPGPLQPSRLRDALRPDRRPTGSPSRSWRDARLRTLLEAVDLRGLGRAAGRRRLVVPSYLEHAYPFTEAEDRSYVFDTLRQAYVPPGTRTCPSGRCGRATASSQAAGCTWCRPPRRSPHPAGGRWRASPTAARSSTCRTAPATTGSARPLVRRPGPDVRGRAPADLRARRPDRGGGGDRHPRARPGHARGG